jgi:hypothetical protein
MLVFPRWISLLRIGANRHGPQLLPDGYNLRIKG